MLRLISCLLLVVAFATGAVSADHVVVSGGPALRKWEDLRVKQDRHDRWWANFIRAATVRIDQELKLPQHERDILWFVYRPGYESRSREDGQPYTTWIANLASKRGIRLVWFSSGEEFIRLMNSRPARSIRKFDYFGHSNRHCFMFDYGCEIMAASVAWLHEGDISKIESSIFDRDAICTSWGCHTGESMSAVWRRWLGVPLHGVVGPTSYTMVGHGELPLARGKWSN